MHMRHLKNLKVIKALTLVSLINEVSEFFLKPNKQDGGINEKRPKPTEKIDKLILPQINFS